MEGQQPAAPSRRPLGDNDRRLAGGLKSYLDHGRFWWLQWESRRLDSPSPSWFDLGW